MSSEKLTTKPITSPDKGSMPAGPCRDGVAVIRNVAPSGLLICVLCHGANPSAGVPSRCAPASVPKVDFNQQWSFLTANRFGIQYVFGVFANGSICAR